MFAVTDGCQVALKRSASCRRAKLLTRLAVWKIFHNRKLLACHVVFTCVISWTLQLLPIDVELHIVAVQRKTCIFILLIFTFMPHLITWAAVYTVWDFMKNGPAEMAQTCLGRRPVPLTSTQIKWGFCPVLQSCHFGDTCFSLDSDDVYFMTEEY